MSKYFEYESRLVIRKTFVGLASISGYACYRSDYNFFLEGAAPSSFGDKNSMARPDPAKFNIEHHPLGATVTFQVNAAASALKGPLVDATLAGIFLPAGQSLQDHRGKPIQIESDILDRKFKRPIPGPLAELKPGVNTIKWSYQTKARSKR